MTPSSNLPPTPAPTEPAPSAFLDAARLAADWLIRNQVQNPYDANWGRLLGLYNVKSGHHIYSTNWTNGTSIMGFLMLHHRTGEPRYLEAARLAAGYLFSLQILDPRDPLSHGAFREETPQMSWCYPRDGLTAAWALLWMFHETGDEEFLYRVKLFNDWFFRIAMAHGWPLWEINWRGEPCNRNHGNFHGGDAAYFFDYYRVTDDDSVLDRGVRFIADTVLERFLDPQGRYKIVWDPDTQTYLDGEDAPQHPMFWQIMHRYNDDFTTIGLLNAYLHYNEDKYLERTRAFADWLISEQTPAGGYGHPSIASASATCPLLLTDLYKITGEQKYLDSARAAGRHLLSLQETGMQDVPKAHGGLYGDAGDLRRTREAINIRVTSYSVMAFLKLEGREQGPYYSVFDREGKSPYVPHPHPYPAK